MLILLLKNKLKTIYLSLTKGRPKDKRNAYIGFAVGIIIFFSILYFSNNLINYLYRSIDADTVDLLLSKSFSVIFGGTFIFIIFTGIATTLFTLFLSKDLDLLMSLPINQRVIFTYKFMESYIVNSYFTFIFIFPLLISYGLTSNIKAAYYPAMIIIVLALYAIPTGIGALLGMLAIRIINPNRAREIIGSVSGIFVLIFVLAFQIIPRYLQQNLTNIVNIGTSNIREIIDSYFNRPVFKFLPTSWAADALHGIYKGDMRLFFINFLFIILTAAALIFICIFISQKLYYYGWSNANQFAISRKKRKERKKALKKYGAGEEQMRRKIPFRFNRGAYYIMTKDFKVLFRDSRRLIQVLSPILILLIVFYLSFARDSRIFAANSIIFSLDIKTIAFLITPLFISGFINIALSANSIGIEGLNYWILKSSPVLSKTLLRVKILFGSIVSFIFSLIMILPVYLFIRPKISYLFLEFLLIMLFSYGFSTITTSIGAIFPEFKPEHSSKNNVTFLGSILTLVSLAIYIAVFTGIVIGCIAIGYFTKLPDILAILIMIAFEAVVIIILFNTITRAAAYSLNNREWNY